MHIKIKTVDSNYKKYIDLIKKSESPKICIVGCLHGNEKIGEKIIKKFDGVKIKRGTLITLMGNQKAAALHKRFVEQDLNRSFPGEINGNHEEGLAYKIKEVIDKCDIVFDIHSTTTDVKSLSIVTKMDKKTLKILRVLNPRKVILMKKSISKKAMINYCKVGISMEYGKDRSAKAYREMTNGINSVLSELNMVDVCTKIKSCKTDAYKIMDVIKNDGNCVANGRIKNFKLVKKGDTIARKKKQLLKADENFYPVLFGEKEYKNILGFKAKKLKI